MAATSTSFSEMGSVSRTGGEMITEQELDEMQARYDATTEGTWRLTAKDDLYFCSSEFIDREGDGQGVGLFGLDLNIDESRAMLYGTEEDGEFMAEAHQDMPRLIAEVRRLKKQLGG